ncbi:hypothetical protein CFC21_014649 [Triticum aestivum]|uniref:F-box domain-containing protein n=2 Tax=Triticum aestivum TaxID=4565 RepID=A0A9R1DUV0_WHEAT|nr:F-box/LRR-repeat protein 13-like isoform X2 [Triticum aestivum]KAF6998533.1 hypothetical protein CFC21_014649 [Triticum aestivum]
MAGRPPFTNMDRDTAAALRRSGFNPRKLDGAAEQLCTYIYTELLPAPPVSGAPVRGLVITDAAHDPALPAADGVDRLSALPDTLLRHILSRLAVTDAARTAALASRWRRLWLSAEPVLVDTFLRPDDYLWPPTPANTPAITAAVSGILEAHLGPFRCVHLTCSHMGAHRAQLARWLQLLAAKGVQELVLVNRPWPFDVPLPDTLFGISTLVRLYIGLWKLPDTAGLRGASFPHLRELGICTVVMEQGDVDSIVARCPVLEILNIQGCHMGLRLRLVSQSLRCVQVCSSVVESIMVVKAPCLERLVLEGCRHTAAGLSTRVSIADAPKLHSIGSLEPGNHVLEIGGTIIMAGVKVSRSSILTSIRTLSLHVRFAVPSEANMVSTYLQFCPNVVRLHITSRKCSQHTGNLMLNCKLGPTDSAMSRIKVMYFREFRGEQSEIAFLKLFYKSAKVLEAAVVIMADPCFTPFREDVAFSKVWQASEVSRCQLISVHLGTGPEGGKAWSLKNESYFPSEELLPVKIISLGQ